MELHEPPTMPNPGPMPAGRQDRRTPDARLLTDVTVLRPGAVTLDEWRAIYRGAPVRLDFVCRADVEASATTLWDMLAHRNGGAPAAATVGLDHILAQANGGGDPLPDGVVRLMLALKITSLGQGLSGVRWALVRHLADCLENGLIPIVPSPGPEGEDWRPLAHLAAALFGHGDIRHRGEILPASEALARKRLRPPALGPREGLALLAGSQAVTAVALSALLEAERLLQTTLVTAAFHEASRGGAVALLHPRVHRSRRHGGPIDVSDALAALMTGDGDNPSWQGAASNRPPDRHAQELGACLDHLRQAGLTLTEEADAVSDEALVLWQSTEIAAAGEPPHLPLLFAAAGIARIILEIGEVSASRFRRASNGAGQSVPAAPDDAGIPPQLDIDELLADNRRRAAMANAPGQGMDGARGAIAALLPMIGNTVLIVAHEIIGTARRPGVRESAALAAVRQAFQARIAPGENGRVFIAELAAAADMVRSGAVVEASGIPMPSVAEGEARRRRGVPL